MFKLLKSLANKREDMPEFEISGAGQVSVNPLKLIRHPKVQEQLEAARQLEATGDLDVVILKFAGNPQGRGR